MSPVQNPIFIFLGLALLAAPAVPSLAQTADPAASVSPLAAAQTIQVHETQLRAGADGVLAPAYSVDVRIQRPDKVKVVILSSESAQADQYVQVGTAEYI